jgi:hypothetical protein
MDFMDDDRLKHGWAMVAWPAEYGSTGIMSFLVSHHGVVYERDLGEDSEQAAKAMANFDPGTDWQPVEWSPGASNW